VLAAYLIGINIRRTVVTSIPYTVTIRISLVKIADCWAVIARRSTFKRKVGLIQVCLRTKEKDCITPVIVIKFSLRVAGISKQLKFSLVPRASFPLTSGQKTRALGASILKKQ